MENKLKCKVIVDRNGNFRCLCCWAAIPQESAIRVLRDTLGEGYGKEIFFALMRVKKYLLEV